MFQELDTVVLTHDVQEHGLCRGDIGAIVHVYDKKNYEVEFVTAHGETIAVLSLAESDIRPFEPQEILHVREMEHAVA